MELNKKKRYGNYPLISAIDKNNIEIVKSSVIFFALGFMLSIVIIFVIYYFDTSIKSSEEIENRLGVPVIGNVPKC